MIRTASGVEFAEEMCMPSLVNEMVTFDELDRQTFLFCSRPVALINTDGSCRIRTKCQSNEVECDAMTTEKSPRPGAHTSLHR